MLPLLLIYVALVALLAWAVTLWVERHWRIIDLPNERSSHTRPTPRGGGLGIVAGVLLALLLILLGGAASLQRELQALGLLGLALALIAGISLHDDLSGRSVASKLLVHGLAAMLALLAGLAPDAALYAGIPQVMLWAVALIWLLGLTNAYNFMDGLDAMAGATAVVVASLFALLCGLQGQTLLMLLSLAIAAASGGFLLRNWPPAHIFMGDVGSTFLGFGFAALGLLYVQQTGPEHSPWAALLTLPILLLHYLFDTVFTFCRRLLRGERVTQAHRSHLYQLLNRSGFSHRFVSLLHAAMALLQGLTLLAWQLAHGSLAALLLLLLLLLLAHAGYAVWVMRRAHRSGLL